MHDATHTTSHNLQSDAHVDAICSQSYNAKRWRKHAYIRRRGTLVSLCRSGLRACGAYKGLASLPRIATQTKPSRRHQPRPFWPKPKAVEASGARGALDPAQPRPRGPGCATWRDSPWIAYQLNTEGMPSSWTKLASTGSCVAPGVKSPQRASAIIRRS